MADVGGEDACLHAAGTVDTLRWSNGTITVTLWIHGGGAVDHSAVNFWMPGFGVLDSFTMVSWMDVGGPLEA